MRESHVNGVLYTSGMLAFSNGRENIAYNDRDGRPKTKQKFGIGEALNEDRKKTIDELADHFDVSYMELFIIL